MRWPHLLRYAFDIKKKTPKGAQTKRFAALNKITPESRKYIPLLMFLMAWPNAHTRTGAQGITLINTHMCQPRTCEK